LTELGYAGSAIAMSWHRLRRHDRVQAHATIRSELAGLRAIVEWDLKDAHVPGFSTHRQCAAA
jgi:hypothetical protein